MTTDNEKRIKRQDGDYDKVYINETGGRGGWGMGLSAISTINCN